MRTLCAGLAPFISIALIAASAAWSAEGDNQREQPVGKPALALSGNCPICMITTQRPVSGKEAFAVAHKTYKYRCCSADHLAKFREDADRNAIQFDGTCIVTLIDEHKTVKGDPEVFDVKDGNLLIFATTDCKAKFKKDPARYLAEARKVQEQERMDGIAKDKNKEEKDNTIPRRDK